MRQEIPSTHLTGLAKVKREYFQGNIQSLADVKIHAGIDNSQFLLSIYSLQKFRFSTH